MKLVFGCKNRPSRRSVWKLFIPFECKLRFSLNYSMSTGVIDKNILKKRWKIIFAIRATCVPHLLVGVCDATGARTKIARSSRKGETERWKVTDDFCSRSPRVGGPLSQSLALIPPTMHGHDFNQPLSRVVMVRKTDQRTFSKGRSRGGDPVLETVTRETVELFSGGRAERKFTSETRDIVTPKSNR